MNSGDAKERGSHSSERQGKRFGWRRSAVLLLALLLPYGMVTLMLTFLQRSLIFQPYRARLIDPAELGLAQGVVHTVSVRSHDGLNLCGWLVLAAGRSAETPEQCDAELQSGRPLVLYFPGNAGNRSFRAQEISLWTSLGANVLLFDYRGYGDNPGSPSEEHLAKDAQSIWRFVTQQRGVPGERVILYGESLGGGVAVRLAAGLAQAQAPLGGLVLRSTFSSLVAVAAYHYPFLPVRWALIDRFLSTEYIQQVTCPVLLIHGQRDTIVPLSLARALYEAAPAASTNGIAKTLLVIPDVDHNDVVFVAEDDVRTALHDFLRRTGLVGQ